MSAAGALVIVQLVTAILCAALLFVLWRSR